MDLIKKAKDKIVEAAGFGTTLTNEEFKRHYSNLQKLESQITNLKGALIHYAKSVLSMSAAACATASEVGKFYSSSKPRTASMKLFTEAHFKMEAITDELFKDQFNLDIFKSVDEWLEEVKKAKKLINQTQQVSSQAIAQGDKVKTLHGTRDKRISKGGKLTPQEEQLITDEEAQLEKLTKLATRMKAAVDKDVTKLIEGRHTRFDACFVRLMECQVEFFRHGIGQTETFCPNIENYRKRYPRTSASASGEKKEGVDGQTSINGSTSTAATAASSSTAASSESSGTSSKTRLSVSGSGGAGAAASGEDLVDPDHGDPDGSPSPDLMTFGDEGKKVGEGTMEEPAVMENLFDAAFMGEGSSTAKTVPPTPPNSGRGGSKETKGRPKSITTTLPTDTQTSPPTSELFSISIDPDSGRGPGVPPPQLSPMSPALPSADSLPPDTLHVGTKFTYDELLFDQDDPDHGSKFAVPPTPPTSARGPPKGIHTIGDHLAAATLSGSFIPPTPPPSARGEKPHPGGLKLSSVAAKLENLTIDDAASPSPPVSPMGTDNFGLEDPMDLFPGGPPPKTSPVKPRSSTSAPAPPTEFESFDPLGDMSSTTKPTTSSKPSSTTSSKPLKAPDEPDDLMSFGASTVRKASRQGSPTKEAPEGESNLEYIQRMEAEAKLLAEQKKDVQDSNSAKLNNWEFKNGTRKPIQSLLTSLDTLLWEGTSWQKPSLTDLTDMEGVKKAYRRAITIVHPDKVRNDPQKLAIAERVFEALNTSFEQYKNSGGR